MFETKLTLPGGVDGPITTEPAGAWAARAEMRPMERLAYLPTRKPTIFLLLCHTPR